MVSWSSVPHYHEAELFLATNSSTSGKIAKEQAGLLCCRISFICNMRLFGKPNDSIKQIPLDGPIHLIYQRGAICFPWADAELYVQPGHYVVVWEAQARRVSNDGRLTSEEYTSSTNPHQQCRAFQASSPEQGPTPQAP